MRMSTNQALSNLGFSSSHCPVTQVVMPNMTRNYADFHISYCREMSHYGSDTTALVLHGRVFFILNGNHADALVQAAEGGIEQCVAVFVDRISQANRLSEHQMAVGLAPDPFDLQPTTLSLIGQQGVARIRAACGQ